MKKNFILAIETSCDECAAAIVADSGSSSQVEVISNVIFSQIDLHTKFGGIVPEVASRSHLEMLTPVVEEALQKAALTFQDLSAIAVTQGPGLMGALLVGLSSAKAYALALNIPLIAVDHLRGHLHSLFIANQKQVPALTADHFPMLICLVSGGHTNLYSATGLPPQKLETTLLAQSRDDAAGEAFDKTAKLLGLPYPGGTHINRLAKLGDPKRFSFPRPMPGKLEFSFSGLKTAVLTELKKLGYEPHIFGPVNNEKMPQGQILNDLCASIQEAIVDVLIDKIKISCREHTFKSIALVGGVSANTRLRERLAKDLNLPILAPDHDYCTDNAAMIGACGYFQYKRGEVHNDNNLIALNAYSSTL